MDFERIDKLKRELDQKRPLPPAVLKNLQEVYRVEWTYHSNAIEGNTLSLLETKLVMEEGLTIGGKKLREHFEVINHSEAISYVYDLINRNIEITESTIKSLHQLILKNIDDKEAGQYRTSNVMISGSQHRPPHYINVSDQMERLMQWYNAEKNRLHPVELAARFHFQFVYIHAFIDGNGRTARLLMNFILMRFGFPPAIIKTTDRLRYYETLEEASVRDHIQPFILFIMDCVEESLQRYLDAIS